MSETILKKTKQWFRCVGELEELGLKREPCDVKVKDKDGNDAGKVKGERIMGSVAVRTDKGIHTFNVYFQNLDYHGEPSKQWAMAEAMMEWNPRIGGHDGEPTLVNIEGRVDGNDYVGQDGNTKYSLRWRVSRANTKASPDDTKATTLSGMFFIAKIAPETRTKDGDEEETGRLKVSLLAADNNGKCFPVDCIVEEDMAEGFSDAYEVGQTVNMDIDLVSRHVGQKKQDKKRAFGHAGSVETNSGFDVSELVIAGADDPIEEPDELTTEDENGNTVEVPTDWINPATMKKALKARAQMLDELKKNPPKKGGSASSSGGNSFKEKKAMAKTQMKKTAGFEAPDNADTDAEDEFGSDDLDF